MLAEGVADTAASADFDRCLELAGSDPHGEGDGERAIGAVGPCLVPRRPRTRQGHLGDSLRGSDERTDHLRDEILAGFGMLDWFEGKFDRAVETLLGCTQDLARIEREHRAETLWFVTGYPTCT